MSTPLSPETERVLILNPAAGGIEDPDAVERAVLARGPCRVLRTEGPGDARRFAAAAMAAGAPTVLVGGGDGTVREVAQGFRDTQESAAGAGQGSGPFPEVVILPLGTGNDLARCLGISMEWEAAPGLAPESGRTRVLDLMSVTLDGQNEIAVNAVVLGTGGQVGEVLDAEAKERWGPLSYLRSAAEVMLELEPIPVALSVDGAEVRRMDVLNIVVANGAYAARGIPVAPGADPSDGTLETVVVHEASIPQILTLLPVLLHGSHPDHPAWEYRSAREVRVTGTGTHPLPASLDGEHRKAREIRIRLLEGILPVRVPLT